MSGAKQGHLLMDAGNTSLKLCFEEQLSGNMVRTLVHGSYDIEQELVHLHQQQPINRISLSSVYKKNFAESVQRWCSNENIRYLQAVSQKLFNDLINAYKQPATLGVDRWLGMIALWEKYKQPFFVVSCGTAVTIDAVNDKGKHLGGVIIPGPDLMKQSLLDNTATINDVNGLISVNNSLADNTQDAITTGTWTAVAALIEKMILTDKNTANYGYLTGGCAQQLSEMLGPDWTVEPELVLEGLSIYAAKVVE